MTPDTSSEPQFVPLHDAHAIEQVLIVLQMTRPIDMEALAEVRRTAMEQFSKELPGTSEVKRHLMTFGQESVPGGQLPTPETHGYVMSRTAPNGVVENELRLERESISFRTATYTRWNSVWDQASRYFASVVEIYAKKTSISAVSLNYVDKFIWVGDLSEYSPKQLLKPQSPYICPNVYDLNDLWHSHTGAFLRVDGQTKRLLNVNVDCVQDESISGSRRLIGVSTVLTDMFNQPGYDTFNVESAGIPHFLTDRMTKLHVFSKTVFANVISESMGKRIALYADK